jgi:hypothetical protein
VGIGNRGQLKNSTKQADRHSPWNTATILKKDEIVQVTTTRLIEPYGGKLVDLLESGSERDDLKAYASVLSSLQLSKRSVCDLELFAIGASSPLDRFMSQRDYQGVLDDMRLASDPIFPIPVTLSVEPRAAVRLDRDVALCNSKNEVLAILTIEEIYEWDRSELAQKVLGTTDLCHPLVGELHCIRRRKTRASYWITWARTALFVGTVARKTTERTGPMVWPPIACYGREEARNANTQLLYRGCAEERHDRA